MPWLPSEFLPWLSVRLGQPRAFQSETLKCIYILSFVWEEALGFLQEEYQIDLCLRRSRYKLHRLSFYVGRRSTFLLCFAFSVSITSVISLGISVDFPPDVSSEVSFLGFSLCACTGIQICNWYGNFVVWLPLGIDNLSRSWGVCLCPSLCVWRLFTIASGNHHFDPLEGT